MTDTSEYKDMFIEESREHLKTLNQSLLDFEKNPKDKDTMNKIFRAAHTIKGMSATMNYDKIQKLSHKTEDTLDLIRNNKLEVDSKVIDLIFKCFDGIETMIEDIAANDMTEYDIVGLIEELEKHIGAGGKEKKQDSSPLPTANTLTTQSTTIAVDDQTKQNIIQEITRGRSAYKLTIAVDKTCIMKSIRSFLLLKKLGDSGTIAYSVPAKQSIENGEFETGFEIYYISDQNQNAVEKIVRSVSELSVTLVSPIVYENDVLHIPTTEHQEKPIEKPLQTQPETTKTTEQPTQDKKTVQVKQKTVVSEVQSIRLGMDQLDLFMNLIGELVISKGRLSQIALEHKLDDLSEAANTVDRLTTELQEKIMKIRMIPMQHIFDRFPRMVRDLAKSNNKKINLVIEGEGIELDRTILDEIGDPLVHLLRNSVDHGVETPENRRAKGKPEEGTVQLIAERTRNHVVITVRDDGKGIDPKAMRTAAVKKGLQTQEEVDRLDDKEAINLLFLPGLSTAEKVTSVSGRGVGMDVVKSTIDKLNGSIDITSEIDKGSTISLRLPLTMAIFKALFVGISDETYAIPISNVLETINLTKNDIKTVHGQQTTVLRNDVLSLVSLSDVLSCTNEKQTQNSAMYAVIVQKEDQKIGLIVDKLIGEQEITIKNLGASLKKTKGVSGVTITGDGRVILVIDINTLVQSEKLK
ncbi:MAG: chemotaxis protein CheA [Euryarchaeota archaeon]|nr:chemotaxis protein CheA [Euryarchaeota archaeon]